MYESAVRNALFFGIFAPICAPLHVKAQCAKQSGRIGVRSGADSNYRRGRNMAGTVEKKLAAQGIVLHEPPSPVANYVGFVRTGNLLFISGQVCFDPQGKLIAKGKLGAGVTVEQGNAAARGCAINLLAQVKAALGDLDKVVRVVRLGGFVNSAPDFLDGPKVLNGASDLMVAAFGDKGRHARTTVGVASLPADAAVEVEGVFEVS
jgi:enamine deaminase RidA (YjgF/YER057c/UK114 family)